MRRLPLLLNKLGNKTSPTVLNVGGKIWPTLNRGMPGDLLAGVTVRVADLLPGPEVDYICDVHELSSIGATFDLIVSSFMLEHVEHPDRAVAEMAKCLNPGGLLYIVTNCTFPLHWFPSDYYRFSDQAMVSLCRKVGLTVGQVSMFDAVRVMPLSSNSCLQDTVDSWACVDVVACKGKYAMDIGVGLDGVLYQHPVFFGHMISAMSAAGHRFHCISSHAKDEWETDSIRLKSLGIDPDLISTELMNTTRHGSLQLKASMADRLDVVFDDDGRVQTHTSTPVICPPVDGAYKYQRFI